jgi:hypothetical protein
MVTGVRGFGKSDKPEATEAYRFSILVADMTYLLDT